MSINPDYSLEIKINETELNKAIKKLQDAFKNLDISLDPTKKATGRVRDSIQALTQRNKIIKNLEDSGRKLKDMGSKLIPLAGIGIGIGALVALITEASPMLQGVFKLLQNSILLIFRPIGDFIGFILRPLVVLFMTQVALPFFKAAYPILKKLGTSIGEGLAKFFSDPVGAIEEAITGVDWGGLFGSIFQLPDLSAVFGDLGGTIMDWAQTFLVAPLQKAWESITQWANEFVIDPLVNAWDSITNWAQSFVIDPIMSAWSTFSLFMESLGAAVGSTLQVAWNRLVEWATNVFGSINSVISQSWETLVAVFSLIGSGINNVLHPMFSRLVEWFLDVGGKIAGSLTNAWRRIVNFFGEIADAAERIWRQFKKLLSKISSSVIRFFTGGEERRASGGLITEPVVGIGLSTNRRYTIGETGPEMVTPLSGGAAGAGAGTVNLTVNMNVASNVDMQRAIGELEQRMQKLLRRRGMI